MSIVTKTGDRGTTGLMYNHRVSKAHRRIEACGCIDELNAALGLARATARRASLRENLLSIQRDLVTIMGEVATRPEDRQRYARDGFAATTPAMTAKLERWIAEVEGQVEMPKDWVMPGATIHSAALDLARTACRRAERRLCELADEKQLPNPEIIVYVNRLSDLLWLLARWTERVGGREFGSVSLRPAKRSRKKQGTRAHR